MEGQLRKLRNCIHPKTGTWLPAAIELDPEVRTRPLPSDELGKKTPEGFYRYEPVAPAPATASDSSSGSARWLAMRARIRAKELATLTSDGTKVDAGSEAHSKGSTCKGKYRIRSKGAACHGRACCEGD